MKAIRAQYRPSIQNKPIPKRRPNPRANLRVAGARATRPVTLRQTRAPRRRQASTVAVRPNGMNIFGLLTLAGAFLALLFVTALHWQRSALHFGQQEITLRSALDQTQQERRQLLVEQRRALSPRETEQRSRPSGLAPVKLDERTSAIKAAPKAAAKNVMSKTATPTKPQPITGLSSPTSGRSR